MSLVTLLGTGVQEVLYWVRAEVKNSIFIFVSSLQYTHKNNIKVKLFLEWPTCSHNLLKGGYNYTYMYSCTCRLFPESSK